MCFQGQRQRFSGLWLVAALSCPTAILNWLWVDWNHISRVTFITFLVVSLHWALWFPRSNCKRFLSFRSWSWEEIILRGTGMSLSARRVTLPAITPIVLQKRVCDCFCFFSPFFSFFFQLTVLFINMLKTAVLYCERNCNLF